MVLLSDLTCDEQRNLLSAIVLCAGRDPVQLYNRAQNLPTWDLTYWNTNEAPPQLTDGNAAFWATVWMTNKRLLAELEQAIADLSKRRKKSTK